MMKGFSAGVDPIELLSEREAILTLLPQTSPGMLQRDIMKYTIDPRTRYKNVGGLVPPGDVSHLYDHDTGSSSTVINSPTKASTDIVHTELGTYNYTLILELHQRHKFCGHHWQWL
jgi:hypothetical protein